MDDAALHSVTRWNDLVVAVPVVGVGGVGVGQVLVERAAGDEGHHLHAEAHAQHRGARAFVGEEAEEERFVGLARGIDAHGGAVRGHAEGLGDGVVAAGQDEGVAERQVRAGMIGDGREDDWSASRAGDGMCIGGGDGVARAIAHGLDVCGDADNGLAGGACDAWAPGARAR